MADRKENLINSFYVTDPDVKTPYQYPVQLVNVSGKKKTYHLTFNILLFNITDPTNIKLKFNYTTREGESDYIEAPLIFDNPREYKNANIRLDSDLALIPNDISTFNLKLLTKDDILLDKKTFLSHIILEDAENVR